MFGSGGGESTLATGSFYQPYPVIGTGFSSEFHPNSTQHQPQQHHHHHHHFNNICPTSSTSTGSNTSMHSTSESSAALENDLRHFSRQQQKRC